MKSALHWIVQLFRKQKYQNDSVPIHGESIEELHHFFAMTPRNAGLNHHSLEPPSLPLPARLASFCLESWCRPRHHHWLNP